ncbi:tail fiber protein [Enterobacter cloacae]|uniref:tail fiber protein n=1 Tax=Enterobacter cloacae TaxID=550 RepID=UPI0028E209E6|nr:tail fiber protein [Enterobacter cloacae]WNT20848.1 tail fiber protein [Enterobacter cloacae]
MLYNTGTIAINGNTATGTGTNWTAPASQVRAGQTIIVMSNPVQMFQISSVNSATSMTVTPAASPALSGQKYGILVSDNISVDGLAQAMSQLIKEYDENIGAWETFATTSANQSITVTINGTPVTIPGIGKLAQKGSNGALAIADGGTGATTVESARSNLGLKSAAVADILGTVSQSGGVPTGAVIEKGSNSNGEYVRFADGTQICRMAVASADAVNKNVTTAGSLGGYRSSQNPVPFPANFAAPAYCSGHINNNGHNVRIELVSGSQASCSFAFHAVNSGTYSGDDTIYITAIGRWF